VPEVIWTKLADEDLGGILQFLEEGWGDRVANRFLNHTLEIVQLLAHKPQLFPLIQSTLQIRKCVLTKHNTLYFKATTAHILILRIYDTRQDPAKLRFN